MIHLMFLLLIQQSICIKNNRQYAAYFNTKNLVYKEKKGEPCYTIGSSTDTTVTYGLYNSKGLNVELYRQFTTQRNDVFIINGKKIEYLNAASKKNDRLILYKEVGMFNLESCFSFIVETIKCRRYFVFKGSVQGAAGNMSSLQLFFLIDFTNIDELRCYHLQNWAPYDFSFFDFNNDGYLDFSFFRDLNIPKNVEIVNYSLLDYQVLFIKNKRKWKGLWGKDCLYIR